LCGIPFSSAQPPRCPFLTQRLDFILLHDEVTIARVSATEKGEGSSPPMSWQFMVAIGLLVGFAGLVVYMLATADGDSAAWERQVYVFGAVEAIVFTAVGWIFGREVHRASAEDARQDAEQAKREAAQKGAQVEALTEDAVKGHTLAAAIDATEAAEAAPAPASSGAQRDVGARRVEAPKSEAASLAMLRSLAKTLYDK